MLQLIQQGLDKPSLTELISLSEGSSPASPPFMALYSAFFVRSIKNMITTDLSSGRVTIRSTHF
jgi:hypothetical protein